MDSSDLNEALLGKQNEQTELPNLIAENENKEEVLVGIHDGESKMDSISEGATDTTATDELETCDDNEHKVNPKSRDTLVEQSIEFARSVPTTYSSSSMGGEEQFLSDPPPTRSISFSVLPSRRTHLVQRSSSGLFIRKRNERKKLLGYYVQPRGRWLENTPRRQNNSFPDDDRKSSDSKKYSFYIL